MSCDRCKDIHKAQIEGKTQKECGCNCHNHFDTGTSTGATIFTNITTANTTGAITLDACDTTGNILFTDNAGACNTTFGINCICGCGCC